MARRDVLSCRQFPSRLAGCLASLPAGSTWALPNSNIGTTPSSSLTIPGRGFGFSAEAPEGMRFLTRNACVQRHRVEVGSCRGDGASGITHASGASEFVAASLAATHSVASAAVAPAENHAASGSSRTPQPLGSAHLPPSGQLDYAHVNMNKGLGERWFCTEAEDAGWRKALK